MKVKEIGNLTANPSFYIKTFVFFDGMENRKVKRQKKLSVIKIENKMRKQNIEKVNVQTILDKLSKEHADAEIDYDEYLSLKEYYEEQLGEIENGYLSLKEEIKKINDIELSAKIMISKMKPFSDLKKIDSNVMLSLVEKISILSSCEITIHLKYADEFNSINKFSKSC